MLKFYENRFTGELLIITPELFIELCYNPNQWDEISEARYIELKLKQKGK